MPQQLPDGTHVTARHWGITRSQLEAFYSECRADKRWDEGDLVTDFVQKFVKPATEGTRMGLALSLNQDDPRNVNLMISHAWQEGADNFFTDVLEEMRPHEVAYICFLSNYQGSPEEIAAQLGNRIDLSPFTQVLNSWSCERLLVVPNEELKRNEQGLYSRLWCDWEIKVAADAGLPIHITHRNSIEHLLGSEANSSRDARCGDPRLPRNKDETMIRNAISEMHVVSGKFLSMVTFAVSVCFAYAPRVALNIPGLERNGITWLWGYVAGIIAGFVGVICARPIRQKFYSMKCHDGYRKLDVIIKAACQRTYYRHRRFRPEYDLPVLVCVAFCGACLASFSRWWNLPNGTKKPALVFNGTVNGLYLGLLLWPVLNVNGMGPWTRVFIIAPRARLLASLLLLGCILCGACFGLEVLECDGRGQGSLWGMLVGLAIISWRFGSRMCAFGFSLMLHYMIGIYFVMAYTGSWLLWRDTFLVVLGASSVMLVPGWSYKQRVACRISLPLAVSGLPLLALLGYDRCTRCSANWM